MLTVAIQIIEECILLFSVNVLVLVCIIMGKNVAAFQVAEAQFSLQILTGNSCICKVYPLTAKVPKSIYIYIL